MKASFVDLRKKSSEIIQALNRNESITLLYRGKPKAVMQAADRSAKSSMKAKEHCAFGLWQDRDCLDDVDQHVRKLRRGRFNDL